MGVVRCVLCCSRPAPMPKWLIAYNMLLKESEYADSFKCSIIPNAFARPRWFYIWGREVWGWWGRTRGRGGSPWGPPASAPGWTPPSPAQDYAWESKFCRINCSLNISRDCDGVPSWATLRVPHDWDQPNIITEWVRMRPQMKTEIWNIVPVTSLGTSSRVLYLPRMRFLSSLFLLRLEASKAALPPPCNIVSQCSLDDPEPKDQITTHLRCSLVSPPPVSQLRWLGHF